MRDFTPILEGPAVTLGGRSWIIADLAPKQYRKVIPLIVGLSDVGSLAELTEARIANLVEAFYIALTRAYPDLTREEWDDFPVTILELMAAQPVLNRAAGLVPKGSGPGEPQPSVTT